MSNQIDLKEYAASHDGELPIGHHQLPIEVSTNHIVDRRKPLNFWLIGIANLIVLSLWLFELLSSGNIEFLVIFMVHIGTIFITMIAYFNAMRFPPVTTQQQAFLSVWLPFNVLPLYFMLRRIIEHGEMIYLQGIVAQIILVVIVSVTIYGLPSKKMTMKSE